MGFLLLDWESIVNNKIHFINKQNDIPTINCLSWFMPAAQCL